NRLWYHGGSRYNDKVKVLFITRKFPPSTGGMELFAFDLSNALADKASVTLVKWGGQGRLRAVLVALPYLFCRAFWKLLTGKIDVVHAQDGVLAPLAYILSRLFRKPFVVVVHGLDVTYRNPLFRVIAPWAMRRASVVICISQAAAQAAAAAGVPADKLRVIPLAVTDSLYGKSDRATLLRKLQLPADSKILLTVGRLIKRKGVAWFIDAVLPGLVKQHPELVYLVIGEGQEQATIQAAIDKHALGQQVPMLGRAESGLYEAAYNGADVFVMPNITVPGDMEGFGLVLLEASACALPVVAADTEGIQEAVSDGQNGVLVSVGDAAAFSQAIDRFLRDQAYARQFGKQSRKFTLQTYQWDALADRYLELYTAILKRRKA
ncbi:MAG TPA: glycosyltransferase family 4 protein, partial [Verrucomicrobiae bacterium]|nr:glycosyltransferase family 4 protein [Verrucomicrobiae bacterium]